jgi:HSP20 family protein
MRDVAFARWDPLRDLLAIQQRLDRFAPGPAGWQPPVDLYETADAYVLTAEIPGVARDDLDIQTGDGRLVLSGVRQERAVACEQFHRLERGHGSFQRSFQLPLPIDDAAVTADLKDGVLTIRIPKLSAPSTRRIPITP